MIKAVFWGLGCLAALSLGLQTPAQGDEKAEALMQEVIQVTKNAKTLTADILLLQKFPQGEFKITGRAALKKPNLARIDLSAPSDQVIFSDGKSLITFVRSRNHYMKEPADANGKNIRALWAYPLSYFFTGEMEPLGEVAGRTRTYKGMERVDGKPYQVIEEVYERPKQKARLYIHPDKFLSRITLETTQQEDGKERTVYVEAYLQNLLLNQPIAAQRLAFTPPKTAKQFTQPRFDEKFIAIGKPAPGVQVATPQGGQVSLGALAQKSKAVLVNFWFYSCPPCREEFPKLQKLYEELKEKGFEILALNNTDDKETIAKYIAENGFTFSIGMSGKNGGGSANIEGLFGVQAFPTNYLIGADGKVIWRGVGFDEKALRAALAKVGLN